jgi:hypothetical protein
VYKHGHNISAYFACETAKVKQKGEEKGNYERGQTEEVG